MFHGVLVQGQFYFLGFLDEVNNTASGVPCDVAQPLYKGVLYRGADKSLARATTRCVLFDSWNISFDASLVICVYIYIYIYK
jgi:hypothetical protein